MVSKLIPTKDIKTIVQNTLKTLSSFLSHSFVLNGL
jgi:hypothetical protein